LTVRKFLVSSLRSVTSQQLREELEAATGGARGADDPGHGALRIAAQGSKVVGVLRLL
jgi:hypothetical protein